MGVARRENFAESLERKKGELRFERVSVRDEGRDEQGVLDTRSGIRIGDRTRVEFPDIDLDNGRLLLL